jgi:hypothetical protein
MTSSCMATSIYIAARIRVKNQISRQIGSHSQNRFSLSICGQGDFSKNENTKSEKIFMTQSLKKSFNFLMLECMEIEVIFKNSGRSVLPLL